MFILEALQAEFGDSLILHYGTASAPKFVLIDGGPDTVYENALGKRLEQLRKKNGGQLKLEMVMVSHIDRDHITGILALTDELVAMNDAGQQLPYKIVRLWHNSFDDFVKKSGGALNAAVASAVQAAGTSDLVAASFLTNFDNAVVVADVKQGRELRGHAKKLSLSVNKPFEELVIAPSTGKKVVSLGGNLKFTVIGPNQQRVDALQDDWAATLKKLKLAKKKEAAALVAAYLDKSIPNLSSITVLAEADGKTMLLTGDARGDDILAGLKAAGLLTDGKLHVDLLKLPHHGSDRNVSTDFFRKVTADHYVASANGKNGNPDIPTMQMISEARGADKYTVYFTNKEKRFEQFLQAEKAKGKKFKFVYRAANSLSVQVKLVP